MFRISIAAISGLLWIAPVNAQPSVVPAVDGTFVWMEGEAPTSSNIEAPHATAGRQQYLSGERWLNLAIEPGEFEARKVPDDGVVLAYEFEVANAARHEVWNRVGFEFARSPFQWRVDDGPWADVSPDDLTTDLMELGFFSEVAWIKLTDAELRAGKHKLELRIPRPRNEKGEAQRILYASDAICVAPAGTFKPNSKFKPNETGRDEADLAAEKVVFALPDTADAGARSSVKLEGTWEIARHDETLPAFDIAQPISDTPTNAVWRAIPVPADKAAARHDYLFAHRVFYRTRVAVPASAKGRSFTLHFPANNLNTTVYVNGVLCGFEKNPFAPFTIDVTKGVKAGETNEVLVGVRDAWYGYSTSPTDPMKLRRKFNLPRDFFGKGFQDLAYPVWDMSQSGILSTPVFTASGPTYVADAFANPSVKDKRLNVELTLKNTTGNATDVETLCEAVNAKTGEVEQTFAAQKANVPAGADQVVKFAGAWADPKLWWPDQPNMYVLRTTVRTGGKTIDVHEQPFGFREWSVDGIYIRLNGVKWHGFSDTHPSASLEELAEVYKKENQTTYRIRKGTGYKGKSLPEAMAFMDRAGVVVRLEGILDGQALGYFAIEPDEELKKLYKSEVKVQLYNNVRDQLVARAKALRNHPSLAFMTLDNEFAFINCYNLYQGQLPEFYGQFKAMQDAIHAVAPQAMVMVDGLGAGQTEESKLQVHGDHYLFPQEFGRYPAEAYKRHPRQDRKYQDWDEKRPRFPSEDYYGAGIDPYDYAYIGGEECFQGKTGTKRAAGILARVAAEGYRWADFAAFQLFLDRSQMGDAVLTSYKPLAVFCKQWDWTFGSGQRVTRELGIFNDLYHDVGPITFTWSVNVGGKPGVTETKLHAIAPGENEKFAVTIPMPQVTERQEGELVLTLSAGGKEYFREAKAISLLPVVKLAVAPVKRDLLVLDPKGETAAFLTKAGAAFTPVASLADLKDEGKVLVIGKDALSKADATSTRLAVYAASGRRVVVLEQADPLKYAALGAAEVDAEKNEGRVAFAEDLSHPVVRGLQQKDFFTWSGDKQVVYRDAYAKPARGARSLVQCAPKLRNSAVLEIPVGEGLIVLSQLAIAENLADNVTAQALVANFIDYANGYVNERHDVVAAVDGPFGQVLDQINLQYGKAADPLAAIGKPGTVAIVSATPANLAALAGAKEKVDAFTRDGGWLVLHGLTPDGLADYNRLVGVDHMIRPFRRERVTLAQPRPAIAAGLTLNDVVMYTSEQVFSFAAGHYLASDTYQYVVDATADVAPFADFKDVFTANMVNGMTNADGWPYIVNIEIEKCDWTLRFPRPVTVVGGEFINNLNYLPATEFRLSPGGNASAGATVAVKPIADAQPFDLPAPLTGKEINLKITKWQPKPGTRDISGLDNIKLLTDRPAEFTDRVKPIVNNGGLVTYPAQGGGKGGILLANLWFKDREDEAANYDKKRNVLATLLRNLKAPFAGGRTVVAGSTGLTYAPVDLSKAANAFRDERGWFGDGKFTFRDIPVNRQKFAGVEYDVYSFKTSPVPEAVVLGGPNVPGNLAEQVTGIAVNAKADALFFLQTARMEDDWERRERERAEEQRRADANAKPKPSTVAQYVVHYADGQTAVVPVLAGVNVANYRVKEPQSLPGAQLAWAKQYTGTDEWAAAYAQQWNNPRPDVAIASIDLTYPDGERHGVPALLAISTAVAAE